MINDYAVPIMIVCSFIAGWLICRIQWEIWKENLIQKVENKTNKHLTEYGIIKKKEAQNTK